MKTKFSGANTALQGRTEFPLAASWSPANHQELTEFSAGNREHQNHVWYLDTNLMSAFRP